MALGPLAIKEHIELDAKPLLIKKSPYLQFIGFPAFQERRCPILSQCTFTKNVMGNPCLSGEGQMRDNK